MLTDTILALDHSGLILALPSEGSGGSNQLDGLVQNLIGLFTTLMGLGFIYHAAKAGFGKGTTSERFKGGLMEFGAGVCMAILGVLLPKFLGTGENMVSGLFGNIFG